MKNISDVKADIVRRIQDIDKALLALNEDAKRMYGDSLKDKWRFDIPSDYFSNIAIHAHSLRGQKVSLILVYDNLNKIK